MDKKELRERVLKTFVEAFFAVLLPDVGILVNQIINEREVWWAVLLPVVASAIATGISAAWNVLRPPKASSDAVVYGHGEIIDAEDAPEFEDTAR